MSKYFNVFISHYHKDEENIKKMKELLGTTYQFKNSSVTSEKFNRAQNPEYIKRLLRLRINWAGQFICLIGPETHNSEWVNYEIEQAHKKGKNIIGVFVRGASDVNIPEALNDYANAIVGWQSEKIIDALKGNSKFENANGTDRHQANVARGNC